MSTETANFKRAAERVYRTAAELQRQIGRMQNLASELQAHAQTLDAATEHGDETTAGFYRDRIDALMRDSWWEQDAEVRGAFGDYFDARGMNGLEKSLYELVDNRPDS